MNEIEAILCSLNHCDRSHLYLDDDATLLDEQRLHSLEGILRRRISGQPLQYVLGEAEFMGLFFYVKPGVLVPRPETEILVEEALGVLRAYGQRRCRLLDMGTGSGNIAVACARLADRDLRVDAVDVSREALACARRNVRRHGVGAKVRVHRSDLFACFGRPRPLFDLICSNPPYVTEAEYGVLPRDVLQEPRIALVAPEEGLYYYGKIEAGARLFLRAGGHIFFEMDPQQAVSLRQIFGNRMVWTDLRVIKDHCGRDRVFAARKALGATSLPRV